MSENRCNVRIDKVKLSAFVHAKEGDDFSIGIGLNDTFQFNGVNFSPIKFTKIIEIWSLPYKSAKEAKFFVGLMKSGKVIGKAPINISNLPKNVGDKIKLKLHSAKGMNVAKVNLSIVLEEDAGKSSVVQKEP